MAMVITDRHHYDHHDYYHGQGNVRKLIRQKHFQILHRNCRPCVQASQASLAAVA